MNPSDLSGFDPRVQEQLAQLSLDASSISSQSSQPARSSDSRQPHHPRYNSYTTHIHPRNASYPSPNQDYYATMPGPPMPPDLDAFPPLGSVRLVHRDVHLQPPNQNSTMMAQSFTVSPAAQDFFSRTRGHGRGRGRRGRGQQHQQPDRNYRASDQSYNHGPLNNFSRPPPNRQQHSTDFGGQRNFVSREEQHFWRQKSMLQADYLNFVLGKSVINSLSHEELKAKHTFRKKLEKIAQDLMTKLLHTEYDLATTEVSLESYGSLSNSFGTIGCDMDLILLVRRTGEEYTDIPWQFQHRLAKALLDQDIGAKLLINTHVPILQVCEIPNTELLTNLRIRQARLQSEAEEAERAGESEHSFDGLPVLSAEEEKQAAAALKLLDHTAIDVPLPDSPVNENAKIEFVGDCGIQCDINFTKRVAIFNTRLLWTYGQCDQRVRPIILFIKNWAKARDINTPYQGTLSSYGWVMLGLHYLMNIANPPVIPNLQQEARLDAWAEGNDVLENFEDYDVAFVKDPARIEEIKAGMPRNKESMGGLLQGFFKYYAHNSGFRWTQDVISIRTQGGLLSKQFKGWTALKRSEDRQNVRHRYLLAIEDPFEIEHNIGRTVGHNGVVAIRDEFRRAWEIIENVQRGQPGQENWIWLNREKSQSGNGLDLISKAEKRGDLLRKDQEARREKLAEMRRLAEEREESAKKDNLESDVQEKDELSHNGMLIEEECTDHSINLIEDTSQLIHNLHHQDEKVSRMRARTASRQRIHCEEDDDDWEDKHSEETSNIASNQIDDFNSSDLIQPATDTYNDADNYRIEEEPYTDQVMQPQHYISDLHKLSTPEPSLLDSTTSSSTSNKKVRFVDSRDYPEENGVLETSKKVGPYIAWSKSSKAGRWLLKRDQKIRAGTFRPITFGEEGMLSATFRYDPDMTQEELDRQNEILETLYKDELHPRIPQSHEKFLNDAENFRTEDPIPIKVESAEQWTPPKDKTEAQMLQDWPVTDRIWWSDRSSAGRWLLWRDRKISHGAWVEKRSTRQNVGDKLSELYPYHGEKTFGNVERMNTELDTFFLNIEFPRPEMDKETRSACTAAIEDAIEKVREHRRTVEHRQPQLMEIYSEFQSKLPASCNRNNDDTQKESELVEADDQQPVSEYRTQWANSTDTGRWLQKRDEKIYKGNWKNKLSEDGILSHINKVFPFNNNRSSQEQEKLNQELQTFCSDFVLPGHLFYSTREQELAYQAMLKIVEQRKDHDETKRVDVLLDLFKHQAQTKRPSQTYFLDKDVKPEETADRQAQVVRNLSQSLKSSSNDTKDFVRQQRLAFYGQQQKMPVVVEVEKFAQDETDDSHSKDSVAEGSWSKPLPCSVCQLTNQHQLTGTFSTEIRAFCSQHDPVTTDESEVVPNTLLPNTWREEFCIRRDEDPRIMPIPRTLDFPFDLRQMADIETIRAGGNGCTRGGLEFTLESDLHSWGGGGAMAQKTNKWSCQDGENDSCQVGDGGDPLLMKELPDLSDIGV